MLRKKFELTHASNKNVIARLEITLPAGGQILLTADGGSISVSDERGIPILSARPSFYRFREVFASIVPTAADLCGAAVAPLTPAQLMGRPSDPSAYDRLARGILALLEDLGAEFSPGAEAAKFDMAPVLRDYLHCAITLQVDEPVRGAKRSE